jgi:CMP-N-acetylneuraminic acid synthetase
VDIRNAVMLARSKSADAVVSVCETVKYPYKTHSIAKDGSMRYLIMPDGRYMDRQSLPRLYEQNGAIYLNRTNSLVKHKTFVPRGAIPYIMPQQRSLDIDTAWDFHIAELILTNKMNGGKR